MKVSREGVAVPCFDGCQGNGMSGKETVNSGRMGVEVSGYKKAVNVLQIALDDLLLELKMMVDGADACCGEDLRKELADVSSLNPEDDILKPRAGWVELQFVRNGELYQKYFPDELLSTGMA